MMGIAAAARPRRNNGLRNVMNPDAKGIEESKPNLKKRRRKTW
jgi:hypothetical protein